MDDLDRRLIGLLRDDARLPVASLASSLGLARATVRARIDRLVAAGVIRGFTVRLGAEMPAQIRAIALIEVEGRATDRVTRRLQGFPEVRALHATNGRWDLVAELEVADLPAFHDVLARLREIDGISATETNLLLAQRK